MPRTTLLRKQVTPTGTIQPHAGGTAPDGFLVCDGSIVNIADYPKLYAVIGTSWGHGNNDGLTFHLPDLRGRFLRGVDDTAGRDPDSGARTPANAGGNSGDAVGSVQADAFQGHEHLSRTRAYGTGAGAGSPYPDANNETTVGIVTKPGYSAPRYTDETRPVNANVTYVIKVV